MRKRWTLALEFKAQVALATKHDIHPTLIQQWMRRA